MNFSLQSELNADFSPLLVCSNGDHLNETFAALFASLDDKTNFAPAQLLQNQKLNALSLWRIDDFALPKVQKQAQEIAQWAVKQQNVAIDLSRFNEHDAALILRSIVAAIGEASYQFNFYKQEVEPQKLNEVHFVYPQQNALQTTLLQAEALLYGINFCKNLANTGSNICTPTFLAQTAADEAKKLGAEAKILGKDYIQQNMPSFWGVAKGSKEEPQLLELRYFGAADKSAQPIVLVGKGLTFDSGGISLKPGAGMDEMKYDMCGAASVIGTFFAAIKAKLPLNLAVVVATCENMPDGGASKPGDVVKAMNGTTIENLNTDAEGRLVLCDALTYVEQNFQAKAVIDVATLTGACIIALGHVASGLMANNQELADELLKASRDCNDKAWQLPLFEEFKEQLKSNFADMQNIGGRPAGTITAATFLAHFAQNLTWAHLDIAGTAWRSGSNKGATGRPIGLLLQYLINQTA